MAALLAAYLAERSVKFVNHCGTGGVVQAVHVLRDNRRDKPPFLPLRQDEVPLVRTDLPEGRDALTVKRGEALEVAVEGVDRGEILGPVLSPETV